DRLVDFFANLVDRAYVSVRRAGPAIECAESTDHVADIRVIDVAIDDVGDNVAGMTALPNFIRGGSDGRDVVRLEQFRAIIGRQPIAGEHSIENRVRLWVRHRIKSSKLRNNTQSAASK